MKYRKTFDYQNIKTSTQRRRKASYLDSTNLSPALNAAWTSPCLQNLTRWIVYKLWSEEEGKFISNSAALLCCAFGLLWRSETSTPSLCLDVTKIPINNNTQHSNVVQTPNESSTLKSLLASSCLTVGAATSSKYILMMQQFNGWNFYGTAADWVFEYWNTNLKFDGWNCGCFSSRCKVKVGSLRNLFHRVPNISLMVLWFWQ